MAHKRKDTKANEINSAKHDADQTVLERVQELTWAMLDEQLSDDEFRLLENLLLSDDDARDTYVNCVQLHAELMSHYSPRQLEAATAAGKSSPVLGFLGGDVPLGLDSTPDVKS
jgi:hypothetical protein